MRATPLSWVKNRKQPWRRPPIFTNLRTVGGEKSGGETSGTRSGAKRFTANMDQDGIVAIGLLTRRDLNLLGPTFDRLWPVEEFREQDEPFEELLRAIDDADKGVRISPETPRVQR